MKRRAMESLNRRITKISVFLTPYIRAGKEACSQPELFENLKK